MLDDFLAVVVVVLELVGIPHPLCQDLQDVVFCNLLEIQNGLVDWRRFLLYLLLFLQHLGLLLHFWGLLFLYWLDGHLLGLPEGGRA